MLDCFRMLNRSCLMGLNEPAMLYMKDMALFQGVVFLDHMWCRLLKVVLWERQWSNDNRIG